MRCVVLCLDQLAMREACVGGREQRLVQLIQLMKDLCSKSSCLPLSACKFPVCLISPLNAWVAREPGRGEQRGNKTKSEGKNKQGKTFIALTRCRPSSVSSISNCAGCWLVHGLIINHESIQCALCRQIKRIVLWWEGREGIWGVRGRGGGGLPEIRRGGREGWTVLWMDRVFNLLTH